MALDDKFINYGDLSAFKDKCDTTYASTAALSGKQDTLTAGTHISISNDEISTTGLVSSEYVVTIWKGTQLEYDALASHDSSTLYIIS